MGKINDPTWNIAAGIFYDRQLWNSWRDHDSIPDRLSFMFGSYNAGRNTILKAKETARQENLDDRVWPSIVVVAPKVPRWRHRQTLEYVRKIEGGYSNLCSSEKGFSDFLGR
ncbi:MAG TPA: hypothetical protein VI895_01080 [Bdellovibrionota bacterium]|nr:hypothetical protein [Bdellovibrionota bacterium]